MLLKLKKRYHKIAIDMLSLLPDMNQIDRLNEEFQWYRDSPNRVIYLWNHHSNNWNGLLGTETIDRVMVVRQIVITPELFNSRNCFRMLTELKHLNPGKQIMGTISTNSICQAWERKVRS